MGTADSVLPDAGTLEDVLAHFGVKGMRWGQHLSRTTGGVSPVAVRAKQTPGKRVQTTGGSGHKGSGDAVTAAKLRQKAKKSTVDSLSNAELQALVTRLNLEQQYSRLTPKSPGQQVSKFLTSTLLGIGKDEVSKFARAKVAAQVAAALTKR